MLYIYDKVCLDRKIMIGGSIILETVKKMQLDVEVSPPANIIKYI